MDKFFFWCCVALRFGFMRHVFSCAHALEEEEEGRMTL